METIDIAIVVLGVVVLASAVAGAILYEPDGGTTTFNVDWSGDTTSLEAQEDNLGTGSGETEFSFQVPVRNVTTATFRTVLTVGSSHIGQDDLIVNVTAPNGEMVEETTTLAGGSSSASLEASVQISTLPTVSTVQARNASEAISRLSEEHAHGNGTGEWVVVVEVQHGGTQGLADHTVEVTPTVGHYVANVTKASPDVRAN